MSNATLSKSDRNYLTKYLHEDVATICFIKKDGTERILYGTLSEDIIPNDQIPKNAQPLETNPDVRTVFDTEAQGWRSFRWDSVEWFCEGVYSEDEAVAA